MINALGSPQSVLAARRHQRHRPGDRAALGAPRAAARDLAARPGAAARRGRGRAAGRRLRGRGRRLRADGDRRAPGADRAGRRGGDIDVALVAFGVLGDEEQAWQDHDSGRRAGRGQLRRRGQRRGRAWPSVMRQQGHGVDRRAVVGGRRAGTPLELRLRLDQGRHGRLLPRPRRGAARARRAGLVVRPGFVHTKMTEGREPAPLSVTAEQVADAVTEAVADGATT